MGRTDEVAAEDGSPPDAGVTKRCTKCGVDKPLAAYGKQPGGRYGLHSRCRECRQAAEPARYRSKREEILAKQKANPRKRENQRRYERKVRYGVTQEQYDALVEAQGGRCAVCGRRVKQLCIDHDHKTGAVRGLLCSACNVGVGQLGDDPQRLRAAARYLEESPGIPR